MTRKQIWILVTLLLGTFMGALDIFVVAPALSTIQAGLHTTPRAITWAFTAYTLVLVVSQPFVAKLSDLYGRRWVYLACVTLFGAGSALCATSSDFAPFIIGRAVQALGAGGVIPVASAVIADTFPAARRGTALGYVGSVFGLAFILGPLIGAWLTGGAHLGGIVTDWHAIFVVNLPIVAAIILLGWRVLPNVAPMQRADLPFDVRGMVLLAGALFFLIFGLSQLDFSNFAVNFTNEAALPFVLFALFLFVPFIVNERHAADPVVDVRAFSRRQLVIAMCLSFGGGIITSSVVYVPQLVERIAGLKAGAGGYYLVFVAITLFLGTPLVGRMIDRYGSRAVMFFGAVTSVIAFLLLLLAGRNLTLIIVALLLLGLGLSTFVGTPLRYIVLNEAAPDRRAASLAVLTVCSSVGQTVILPLGGALIASATGRDATINGIHQYYAVVLIIVTIATALIPLLKSRQTEQLTIATRPVAKPTRVAAGQPSPLKRSQGQDSAARTPVVSSR
ncbi:MAG: MFS transporter [Ktedonobacterales bacterium]|nr:MFS transporter [Ktedonobacterales bacterium]